MESQSVTVDGFARSGTFGPVAHSTGSGASSANALTAASVGVQVVPSTSRGGEGPVFVSPKGIVDPESGVFVLQYRNQDTGEVKVQYPSKKVVEAYSRTSVAGPSSEERSSSKGGEVSSPEKTSSVVSHKSETTA
jgi:hypothetical protein